MKVEIRESVRSTPERPLWCWRLWDGGRARAFGTAATKNEAVSAAVTALRRLEYQRAMPWPML